MNCAYKTELHCHTSEGSRCSSESTADTINKYIEHGYATLVITNHLQHERIHPSTNMSLRFDSYEEYINMIYDKIDLAREIAGDRLYILGGFELCNCESDNEYLIYGLTREQALGLDMCFARIKDVSRYVRDCGGIIIQAHPMRFGMTLIHPDLVDGYEVFNNSKSGLYVNSLATFWLQINCCDYKIITAGNDHHNPCDIPTAGILTNKPITTDAELIRVLREKDFSIFHDTKMNCG